MDHDSVAAMAAQDQLDAAVREGAELVMALHGVARDHEAQAGQKAGLTWRLMADLLAGEVSSGKELLRRGDAEVWEMIVSAGEIVKATEQIRRLPGTPQ